MAKGRKPKPESLHELAGNPGKRTRQPRTAFAEQSSAVDDFAPPTHLTVAEKKVWDREIGRLQRAGYARPSDLGAFAVYVQALARHALANRVLQKEGLTYETQSGYVRKRPEVEIVQAAERIILAFGKSLALTTGDRLRAATQMAGRQGELPFGPTAPAPTAHSPQPQPAQDSDDPIGYLN